MDGVRIGRVHLSKTATALGWHVAHPLSGMEGVVAILGSLVHCNNNLSTSSARRLTGEDAPLRPASRAQGSLWLGPASPVRAAASQALVHGPEWRTTQSPYRAASPLLQSRSRS